MDPNTRHSALFDDVPADLPLDAFSLKLVLDTLPVGISWARLDDQKIIFMNRKFTEMFGYEVGDFPDIPAWIAAYPFEEERDEAGRRWAAYFADPNRFEFRIEPIELRIGCKNGEVRTFLHSGVILPQASWALAIFVDISDRKRDELRLLEAERQARESQAIHRLLLDHSPGMTILSPFGTDGRYVSPGVLQVTGYTAEEYLAVPRAQRMHPDDDAGALEVIARLRAGEMSQVFRYRALQKSGEYRWVEAFTVGYVDPATNETIGYVANVRDIHELKRREETREIEYQHLEEVASLDDLTGIANRRTFNRTLSSEVRTRNRSRELSLLMLDVDFFKQYNDLYGHVSGDACLRQVASAIEHALRRDSDLAARFGGDEFVALLPITDAAGAILIAQAIVAAVAPMALPHAENPHGIVTVSVGVACWPAVLPLEQDRLLELADRALYQAKGSGRNTWQALSWEAAAAGA